MSTPAWLRDSFVAQVYVSLSNWFSQRHSASESASLFTYVLQWVFARNQRSAAADSVLGRWCLGLLPALGVLCLLVSCTLTSTGVLGAMVAGLTLWLLFFSGLLGQNKWVKRFHILDWAMFGFFATLLIATAFSSVQPEAVKGLAKFSIYFAAFISFRTLWVHAPMLMQWGFPILLVLGVWQTVVGWQQAHGYHGELAGWTDARTPAELKLNRIYGTIQPYNPNLLAAFLLHSLTGGLYVLNAQLNARLRYTWPWSVLLLIVLGACVYGVLLSGSRGAYLGVIALLFTYYLGLLPILKTDATLKQQPWLLWVWTSLLAASLSVLGGVVLQSEKLLHRLQSMLAFRGDSSISYRLNVYASSWRMFTDNWLVGIGPSNTVFKKVYGYYMMPGFNALGTYSVPLEIMVEQGIIGLLAYLNILFQGLRKSLSGLLKPEAAYTHKFMLLGLMAGIIATLTHGVVDTILYRPPIMLPFLFVFTGFISMLENMEN